MRPKRSTLKLDYGYIVQNHDDNSYKHCITTEDVAKELSISRTTLYRWITNDSFPLKVFRDNDDVRYTVHALK